MVIIYQILKSHKRNLRKFLKPLEDAIRHKLIPALTEGRSLSDDERVLISLPVRLGGL